MLAIPKGYKLPRLKADAYYIDIDHPPIRYQRMQIVSNARPWSYKGVLHEFLVCEARAPPACCTGQQDHFDGAGGAILPRSPGTPRCSSWHSPPRQLVPQVRYTFYLAQSCRDSGDRQKALGLYLARAELGGWREEVFVSLLEAARIIEHLGHAEQEVIDAYLKAANAAPKRAEALHGAARYCREKGATGSYRYAKSGLEIALPREGLFVETWIYQWGLLDEYSIHAYWVGRYRESLEACSKLLMTIIARLSTMSAS